MSRVSFFPDRLLNSSLVPSVTSFKGSTMRIATILRWSINSFSIVPHLSKSVDWFDYQVWNGQIKMKMVLCDFKNIIVAVEPQWLKWLKYLKRFAVRCWPHKDIFVYFWIISSGKIRRIWILLILKLWNTICNIYKYEVLAQCLASNDVVLLLSVS